MSRNKGTFPFSANLEGNIRGPIDAKMLVPLYSDLTDPLTWTTSGLEWTYVGMIVSVASSDASAGIYTLIASDYTNITNWVKIGTGSGTGSDASLNALYQYETIQDASIMRLYSTETVSRTIYVDASGSDLTGDGSVAGLPYATIGKALNTIGRDIWSGITTTVNIGVGTFTLSASDLDTLSLINGAGDLIIQGNMVLCTSSFVMGSAQSLDPFRYNVTGGDTSTWTIDKWKYYFLKSGANYYPITHDTSTTLSIAGAQTGTEIYQAQTVINFPAIQVMNVNTTVSVNRCKSIFSNTFQFFGYGRFVFTESYLSSSTIISSEWYINMKGTFFRNSFEKISLTNLYPISKAFQNCYFYGINTVGGLYNANGLNATLANCVFENPSTVAAACCIYYNLNLNYINSNTSAYLKFINSNICLGYNEAEFINHTIHKLIIVNCNYLIKKTSNISDYKDNIKIKVNSNFGIPIIKWFYDPMYEFVNLSSGRNIQITGLLYPEFEQNQSYKLVNNTTTDISIGSIVQNKSISVDYTLSRSNSYAEGAFNIIIDSSANLFTSIDRYIGPDTMVQDPAIQFDAILDGSIVKWRNTLDATGGDASINYNITRVMRTPLII